MVNTAVYGITFSETKGTTFKIVAVNGIMLTGINGTTVKFAVNGITLSETKGITVKIVMNGITLSEMNGKTGELKP